MARTMSGVVTSDVQDKTIVVTMVRRETHPIYRKQYTVTTKFAAHDENNEAHIGDRVVISETRPISKNKSWKLDSIVERGHGSIDLKDESEEVLAKEVKE